jgi:hypothetical protein
MVAFEFLNCCCSALHPTGTFFQATPLKHLLGYSSNTVFQLFNFIINGKTSFFAFALLSLNGDFWAAFLLHTEPQSSC